MTDLPGRRPPPTPDQAPTFRERIENLRHLGRLVAQIWRTSKRLTAASIGLRLVSALQPVAMLYVGKLIIDEVVRLTAIVPPGPGFGEWWSSGVLSTIAWLLAVELLLVIVSDLLARATGLVAAWRPPCRGCGFCGRGCWRDAGLGSPVWGGRWRACLLCLRALSTEIIEMLREVMSC